MKAEGRRRLAAALVAAAISVGGVQAVQPAGAVAPLARFEGTWFEVAAYGSQRQCTRDSTLTMTARSALDADLRSRCRTASGLDVRNGRLRTSTDDGYWRAHFAPAVFAWLPAVWGDFWVLGHDDAMSWFVVGERDHQRLAVYSRGIALDEAAMAQALALARRAGFDVSRLARTVHDPDSWRDVR